MTFWINLNFDVISDGAAALSFYFIFSVFPALLLFFSILSYIPVGTINSYSGSWWLSELPGSVTSIIEQILDSVKGKRSMNLVSFGFIFTIWTAGNGTLAIMRQLNFLYKENENRGFLKQRFIATILVLVLYVLVLAPFIISLATDYLIKYTPLVYNDFFQLITQQKWLKFIIIEVSLFSMFAVIYFLAPAIRVKLKNIIPGSLFGSLILVATTTGFELYINNFSNYEVVYGNIGALIILMLWFYIMGFLLILGGEINKSWSESFEKK